MKGIRLTTEENIQATSGIADTSAAHEPHIQQAEADVVGDSSMDLSGKTFADFGVSAPLCEALKEVDILHPFPIQALTYRWLWNATTLSGKPRPAPARP